MTPGDAMAISAAGLAAGTVNTIVGAGSLITFPTLLALGYAPVLANVTNTVGLVPGTLSGTIGYRRELTGQRSRLTTLGTASVMGGLTGGTLLLALPGSVFRSVVPALILLASGLVILQPALSRWVARRRSEPRPHGGPLLFAAVYVTGVYGGYFGAAQGVILIALLAIFIVDDLQRLNAAKNVLTALVNGVAALLFVGASHVAWGVAALLAAGAVIGGQVGARLAGGSSPRCSARSSSWSASESPSGFWSDRSTLGSCQSSRSTRSTFPPSGPRRWRPGSRLAPARWSGWTGSKSFSCYARQMAERPGWCIRAGETRPRSKRG